MVLWIWGPIERRLRAAFEGDLGLTEARFRVMGHDHRDYIAVFYKLGSFFVAVLMIRAWGLIWAPDVWKLSVGLLRFPGSGP